MKKAIIIIPAYNEEKNITGVINGIIAAAPDADILVVNDGSEDGTEEIAGRLCRQVINVPYNMGYGTALQTGFKYALRKEYEYAVQIDTDGQHDPGDIPKLLDPIFRGCPVLSSSSDPLLMPSSAIMCRKICEIYACPVASGNGTGVVC